jgi:hypothetical protein
VVSMVMLEEIVTAVVVLAIAVTETNIIVSAHSTLKKSRILFTCCLQFFFGNWSLMHSIVLTCLC